MRTISEPATAKACTWLIVDCTSAVSVLVIDCTTTGTSQPTRTAPVPDPILTVTDFLRCISAILPVYSQPAFEETRLATSNPQQAVIRREGYGVQPVHWHPKKSREI